MNFTARNSSNSISHVGGGEIMQFLCVPYNRAFEDADEFDFSTHLSDSKTQILENLNQCSSTHSEARI